MILCEDKNGTYNVCTLVRLAGLGGPTVSYTAGVYVNNAGTPPLDVWKGQVVDLIKGWDHEIDTQTWSNPRSKYFNRLAICYAVVASTQVQAIENLEAVGFKNSGPYDKLRHPDSQLHMMWIGCDELCRNLGYICDEDPRTIEERGY